MSPIFLVWRWYGDTLHMCGLYLASSLLHLPSRLDVFLFKSWNYFEVFVVNIPKWTCLYCQERCPVMYYSFYISHTEKKMAFIKYDCSCDDKNICFRWLREISPSSVLMQQIWENIFSILFSYYWWGIHYFKSL